MRFHFSLSKTIPYALLLSLAIPLVKAQRLPAVDAMGVQVNSYFPQIADGGGPAQKWVTSFTFTNPSPDYSANVNLYFRDNDGQPLKLDLGGGPQSAFGFSLGPQATVTYTSTGSSPAVQVGWAEALSSFPLQSVALYRYSVNGVPQQGVSVPAAPASSQFSSPATGTSGIALANPIIGLNIPITITAIDETGKAVQAANINLGRLSHASFNLNQILPSVPAGFRGSVHIATALGQANFAALVISADGGVLSSYPAAALSWPQSQYERIYKIWSKLLNVVMNLPPDTGLTTLPSLVVDSNSQQFNSYACGWVWTTLTLSCTSADLNTVHIFLNMAELYSDSDGELATVIGHELGHIIQGHGTNQGPVFLGLYPQDREWDADLWGMVLSMIAGYDVYSGAGALGRLYTVSTVVLGQAGLLAPNYDGLGDPHGSLTQRAGLQIYFLSQFCQQPSQLAFCSAYKGAFHPHFPAAAPMAEPRFMLQPPGVEIERR
jgi:Zn-dependent protease with chaperone function